MNLADISAPGLVPVIQGLGDNLFGCELGICRGVNMRYTLDQCPNIGNLAGIDPWRPYQDWCGYVDAGTVGQWREQAMQSVGSDPRVSILEMTSREAETHFISSCLDYIFIDGDHSFASTLADCVLFWSKVKTGGLFAGHDHNLPEVAAAVDKFRSIMGIRTPIESADNNVWYWIKQ